MTSDHREARFSLRRYNPKSVNIIRSIDVALLRQRLNHSCVSFLFICVDAEGAAPKFAALDRRNTPAQVCY